MKYFLICLAWLISFYSKAQPNVTYNRNFGGSGMDDLNKIIPTRDGGFLLLCTTRSFDNDLRWRLPKDAQHGQEWDIWVCRFDKNKELLWQQSIGGNRYEKASDAIEVEDGSFYLTGYTKSTNYDFADIILGSGTFLVKLNKDGHMLWQKVWRSQEDRSSYGTSIVYDGNAKIYVAGSTAVTDGLLKATLGEDDGFILCVDTSGNELWYKTYGGEEGDKLSKISMRTNGNFLACGSSGGCVNVHLKTDTMLAICMGAWMLEINPQGEIVWQNRYHSYLEFVDFVDVPNHGIYAIGYSTYDFKKNLFYPGCRGFIYKIGEQGEVLNTLSRWGDSCIDNYFWSICTFNNRLYVADATAKVNDKPCDYLSLSTYKDFQLLEFDLDLNLVSQTRMGGTADDTPLSIAATKTNELLMGGISYSHNGDVPGNHGWSDAWLVAFKPEQTTATENISSTQNDLQVYPNPAQDKVYIKFNDNSSAPKKLQLLNAQGQLVLETTCTITQHIEVSALPNGLYFICYLSNNQAMVQK